MADRRALAASALVLLGGGALIWLLGPLVLGDGGAKALEARCERVGIGDAVEDAYRELGREGYRKGCGSVTPCETLDLGADGSFLWLCDPDDCSQLWRVDATSCVVDVDPKTRRVTDVQVSEMAL
ncbi:MAG: hypothetical protein GY898_05625 [Proteobacteria bacterium]|nr:hypothetical protein [Pseudomonadota bacterium]